MENEKELTKIPGLPEDEIVVIRKLGFGSLNQLRSKSTAVGVDATNRKMNANVDTGLYMKWLVVFGIKKAKFFDQCRTFDDKARSIDNDCITAVTGDYLYKQIQDLNGFEGAEETKKN